MKRIKRFASLLLAMVMALAMTMTAFATEGTIDPDAEPETPGNETTIPEDSPTDTPLSRTFTLYQIFTGDAETAENGSVTGTLSNVKWGVSAKIPAAGEGEENQQVGDAVPKAVLDALTAPNLAQGGPDVNDRVQLAVIEQYTDFSKAYKTDQPTLDGTTYKYTDLPSGYYLIEDTTLLTDIQGDNTTRSLYVVRVTNGTLEFTPKVSGVPTPDKSVQDANDSDEAAADPTWDKSADYDIGDTIPYQIKATLPDATSMARYETYKLTFYDTFSDGLDFIEITDIKVGSKSIKDEISISEVADYDEGTKELTVTFNDVKVAPINAEGGEDIIIEYTARLNDKAATGSAGNPNTLVLEYPNEPSYNGNGKPGTGTTPPVTAIVFTFKTVINKVDDNHDPLTGAEFTLYKWMKDENTNEFGWVKLSIAPNVTDGTIFDFKGLDDGKYKLEESKTPNGYNTMPEMIFTVVVTHDATLGNSDALTKIEIKNETGEVISGEGKDFEIVNLPGNTNDGVETDIVNKKGSLLPSTGGIGTTIFYVVGGILVVGAGILLVTKKRMSAR